MMCAIYGQIWKHANIFWWKKILNVSNVKLISKKKSTGYGFFLMYFSIQALIKGNQVSICCFFTFYFLKQPLNSKYFKIH